MPETPDFEAIAFSSCPSRRLPLEEVGGHGNMFSWHCLDCKSILEVVRFAWNARGAADLDAIDAAAAYTSPIARAVRTLDR